MAVTRSFSPRKPTQYDVARSAGVSQTTVSLVLNNPDTPSVPEETRQKVFEAVRLLGYVPNSAARMLRTSRTYTLACIIPMLTNPFYPAFLSGIQELAENSGYDVIAYNTHGSPEKEKRFLESVQQGRVDGVIGVFFFSHARDMLPLFEKGLPVVRLEVRRHRGGEWPLDNVFVDNVAAARTATAYLIEKGHHRIAMLTGPGGPRDARREGYEQALANCTPAIAARVVEADNYDETGGYDGMRRILANSSAPDAVFAANDLMAIGAIQAICGVQLKVPEDIAVVGFDDIFAAQMVTPALTTIRQFKEEMGKRAAQLLIERLEGKVTGEGRSIEMPYELVIRDSA